MDRLRAIEREGMRSDVPDFKPGDTVKVMVRVKEGDKTRNQAFEGVCIGRRSGGINESFTVRKISAGVGVERIFPLHSPSIASIELVRRGRVRRASHFAPTAAAARSASRAPSRGAGSRQQRTGPLLSAGRRSGVAAIHRRTMKRAAHWQDRWWPQPSFSADARRPGLRVPRSPRRSRASASPAWSAGARWPSPWPLPAYQIDRHNIRAATILAMRRAIRRLPSSDHILRTASPSPSCLGARRHRGDGCQSTAASVIAKTVRTPDDARGAVRRLPGD
jgi:large subunit ribosomal protein L19